MGNVSEAEVRIKQYGYGATKKRHDPPCCLDGAANVAL
jgi:hypothetical protein